MIPAVHPRGTNVDGLLRYLFGPGKHEEHADPHLIAAWMDAPALADLEPPTAGNGRRDVRWLTELLEQPVAAARNPPAKTVWHCSIRNHPTDRVLTDAQWAHIAGEVMATVGLAPHGDNRAVRWVAVRHAEDHIHLVATLVRQDRRTAWAWKDKLHTQQACRDLEERYGLHRVAPPGSGSRRWTKANEINKDARLRRNSTASREARTMTPFEALRRRVRVAAALATDEDDFFGRLQNAGVLVRLRYSTREPGKVTGYAVGLHEHTTAAGATVWYGGGRLGPDLTLPRLRTRWSISQPEPSRAGAAARLAAQFDSVLPDVYQRAANATAQAAAAMYAATDPHLVSAIASAAADILTTMARTWEGVRGGPLTDAAEALDRAAHEPRQRPAAPPPRVSHAAPLRSMARLIGLMGALSRDRDTMAALHLLYTLAALAESLADLRDVQHRRHQAQAARASARRLRTYTPPGANAPWTAKPRGARTARDPGSDARSSLDRHGRSR
jgi:hypothetical protein